MALHHRVSMRPAWTPSSTSTRSTFALHLSVPRNRIPEHGMLPETALQTVRDELILDGNARLNLATFVHHVDGAAGASG